MGFGVVTQLKAQSEQGRRVVPGEERRRSQRVMIRVPVTLEVVLGDTTVTIRAHTVAVNTHGAMLLCSQSLKAETKLELENDQTRERMTCRITRTPKATPDGFLIPVEFAIPSPGFWQITFPPTDWKPVDD